MIAKLLAAGAFAAFSITAQTYATPAWFPDGSGVELHIETTGSTTQTELTGGGGIFIRQGIAELYRSVQDSHGTTIFGYRLEAYKAPEPNAITIRITQARAGDPTVSDVREFPAVKYGQEVKIEILTNPATGERVYDVLRPIEGRSPAPGQHAIGGVAIPKLVVNGQTLAVKSDWATGQSSPRLYIPGHGAYYLSWESRPKFRLAGYIEKSRLIFLMDSQYVDMTFPGNVLTAEGGPGWIYHDPNFAQGGATCLLDSYHSF